jgi:hypothetical protein
MSRHNENLNSVGTESFDQSADMPVNLSKNIRNMSGGGFLSSLFGDKSGMEMNVTKLLMNAIEQGNISVVDFLLCQKFTPDFEQVDKDGNNLIICLISIANKSSKVQTSLAQIIENAPIDVLNRTNKKGNNALHCTVYMGLDQLSAMLIKRGVRRNENNEGYEVVTDKPDDEIIIVRKGRSSNPLPVEKGVVGSIFVKSEPVVVDQNEMLNQIVRQWRTSTEPIETIGYRSSPYVRNPSLSNRSSPYVRNPSNVIELNANNQYSSTSEIIDLGNKQDSINSEDFMNHIKQRLQEIENPMRGGAAKKSKKGKKAKTHAKVLAKISGHRNMATYSEMNEFHEMEGGLSESETPLSELARAVDNETTKLHDKAVEKIEAILKDMKVKGDLLANAVKAVIYKKIIDSKPELSGLDRAAEMLKNITEANIKAILKDDRKTIDDVIIPKLKEREARDKNANSNENSKDKKEKKEKKTTKQSRETVKKISETSDFEEDDSDSSSESWSDDF